jgi:hypothetical protein
MDFLVHRMRKAAYKRLVKAYSPTLSMEFLDQTLAFDDMDHCVRFVESMNGVFAEGGESPLHLNTQESKRALAAD